MGGYTFNLQEFFVLPNDMVPKKIDLNVYFW